MTAEVTSNGAPDGRSLGVAVVGCGYWGINYARVLGELPGVHVAVVCDAEERRLEEVGRRFPGLELRTSLAEALSMDGVEAAVVATPATTHTDVTRACLEAGKHVLVEKPITTRSGEAGALGDLAGRRRLTLMVGHTFIYNAGVTKVREYLQSGVAGNVYYLYARRTALGPIRRDVNALWDLAPHDVSIFNYLLGCPPDWVSAVGSHVLGTEHADVGFVCLGYPGGVLGHVHVSWVDPQKVREIVVVGSSQRIVFNDLDANERVRVFDKGVVRESEPETFGESFLLRDGEIVSPVVQATEPLKQQCCEFIEAVRSGRPPTTDARFGAEVVRVLEAIDRSLALRGVPIDVLENHALHGDADRVPSLR
jgi:predicted dehydrogenase